MKSIEEIKQIYPDVCISKCTINKEDNNVCPVEKSNVCEQSVMYIIYGGFGNSNPKAYMDDVIACFVENDLYNEFIESTLDNPWTRIIICDINNILN